MTLHCETANHCTGTVDSFSRPAAPVSKEEFLHTHFHNFPLLRRRGKSSFFGGSVIDIRRRRSPTPTASSRTQQSETEKPRVAAKQSANALESEAASAGALQEMGKNQRCSHRTCGHRTFPITATKALSAQVRLGELCRHFQRWWAPTAPLMTLTPSSRLALLHRLASAHRVHAAVGEGC